MQQVWRRAARACRQEQQGASFSSLTVQACRTPLPCRNGMQVTLFHNHHNRCSSASAVCRNAGWPCSPPCGLERQRSPLCCAVGRLCIPKCGCIWQGFVYLKFAAVEGSAAAQKAAAWALVCRAAGGGRVPVHCGLQRPLPCVRARARPRARKPFPRPCRGCRRGGGCYERGCFRGCRSALSGCCGAAGRPPPQAMHCQRVLTHAHDRRPGGVWAAVVRLCA